MHEGNHRRRRAAGAGAHPTGTQARQPGRRVQRPRPGVEPEIGPSPVGRLRRRVESDATHRRGARQQLSMIGPQRPNRSRGFAHHQRVERRQRAEQMQDRLPLVQVQLGKPPQRVAAQREPSAKRHPVDRESSQRLDPGVLLVVGPLLGAGIQIREQIDAAAFRSDGNLDGHHRRTGSGDRRSASTASIAWSTAAVSTPLRQSGV